MGVEYFTILYDVQLCVFGGLLANFLAFLILCDNHMGFGASQHPRKCVTQNLELLLPIIFLCQYAA